MRIGLVLNILDEEYQISVYNGITNTASELGIEIVCFQQENIAFTADDLIGFLPRKDYFDVDGIILLTSVIADNYQITTKEDVEKIWGDLPVVSIGQKVKGIPSILIETDSSMKQMVEHLVLQHKYRDFLFLTGPETHHDAIVRENIFRKTMEAYSPWFPDLKYTVKNGYFTEAAAIHAMEEYIEVEGSPIPDVVVCANDNMAIGVYKFFKMNSSNPNIKECAVTGFDDIPQAKYEIPSLTTVHQPLNKIGAKSVEIIKEMVEKKTVQEENYIESEIMFRKSCGCTAADGAEVLSEEFYRQMQVKYIQAETFLRMVNHVGQTMNYVDNILTLNEIIAQNMNQLGTKNCCILRFSNDGSKITDRKTKSILVDPLFVVRNEQECYEFYREIKIPLGQFYKRFIRLDENNPNSLIIKYLTAGNELIGCMFCDADNQVFPYLNSIALSIAQALVRIQALEFRKRRAEYLEKEVTKRTKELVEVNNKRMEVEAEVLKISEIERQRFSNDLHDDICQRLAGISMLCRSYSNQDAPVEKEQMVELAQLIGETLQCTRQYAHNSYPVELESLGMNHSLSNLCNSFMTQSGINCNYEWSMDGMIELNKLQKLNIFRIIQEALHNVMKHSKATEVTVSVKSSKSQITILIADNGVGIEGSGNKIKEGLGLNSMQYRANQIGATFIIKKNKPNGTCIQVLVDLM